MIDFVNKRYFYFTISLLVALPGIISMILPNGLKTGIEFSSGSSFSVRFEQTVTTDELRNALTELGHPESRIQQTTEGSFLVRTDLIDGSTQAPPFGPAPPSEREDIETALVDRFGPLVDGDGNVTNRFNEFSSVSASVSSTITRNAAIAVVVASIAILIFVTFSFWNVPSPVRYGAATILALAHDVVITLGIASIIGRFTAFEIDSLFITAMLTIIGFSVHDTIVVFDRIRENVSRGMHSGYRPTLAEAVNASLNQTLGALAEHLDHPVPGDLSAHPAGRRHDPGLPDHDAHRPDLRYVQLDLHRGPASGGLGGGRHAWLPCWRPRRGRSHGVGIYA